MIAKPIEGPAAYSDTWYRLRLYDPDRTERPVVFGASEAAAAAGMSPYMTPLALYLEKLGLWKSEPDERAMKRINIGRKLEPVILDLYEETLGFPVKRDLPMYFHPTLSFMGASLDGITDLPAPHAVDAKASNIRMIDRSGEDEDRYGVANTDQLPRVALCQAQQQMAVMGLNRCDFPVLVDGSELRIYRVDRNDDLIEIIAAAEKELAERIANQDPPPADYGHKQTNRLLKDIYHDCVGEIDLGDEIRAAWNQKAELRGQIKMLEAQEKELENRVLEAMGSAEWGHFSSGGVCLKRTPIPGSESMVKRRPHVRLTQVKKGK